MTPSELSEKIENLKRLRAEATATQHLNLWAYYGYLSNDALPIIEAQAKRIAELVGHLEDAETALAQIRDCNHGMDGVVRESFHRIAADYFRAKENTNG